MTVPSTAEFAGDAEDVHQFLAEYIRVHRYAPTLREISAAMARNHLTRSLIANALNTLEGQGRLKRHPWPRGIVLAFVPELHAHVEAAPNSEAHDHEPHVLTVEHSVNWHRLAKEFRGVA